MIESAACAGGLPSTYMRRSSLLSGKFSAHASTTRPVFAQCGFLHSTHERWLARHSTWHNAFSPGAVSRIHGGSYFVVSANANAAFSCLLTGSSSFHTKAAGPDRSGRGGDSSACAIRTICFAISSGDITKSMQPLAMALSGISGWMAVSSFWAIVMHLPAGCRTGLRHRRRRSPKRSRRSACRPRTG